MFTPMVAIQAFVLNKGNKIYFFFYWKISHEHNLKRDLCSQSPVQFSHAKPRVIHS